MKKIGLLLMTVVISLILYGCPPVDTELPDYLSNDIIHQFVDIDFFSYEQKTDDTLIFSFDLKYKNEEFDYIYINSDSILINSALVYGVHLELVLIDQKYYYEIDLKDLNIDIYKEFLLILNVEKNTLLNNLTYDQFLKKEVSIHPISLIFKKTNSRIQNVIYYYKFVVNQEILDLQNKSFDLYTTVDELLEKSAYKKLYLPYLGDQVLDIQPEIVYYENEDQFTMIKSSKFSLAIRLSDSPLDTTGFNRQTFLINDILFVVLYNNGLYYSIDFVINENEKNVLYSYFNVKIAQSEIVDFLNSIKPKQ
jgi:hypothetical protein